MAVTSEAKTVITGVLKFGSLNHPSYLWWSFAKYSIEIPDSSGLPLVFILFIAASNPSPPISCYGYAHLPCANHLPRRLSTAPCIYGPTHLPRLLSTTPTIYHNAHLPRLPSTTTPTFISLFIFYSTCDVSSTSRLPSFTFSPTNGCRSCIIASQHITSTINRAIRKGVVRCSKMVFCVCVCLGQRATN